MIIWMNRPLANYYPDGPASCKWSSGWTGLLQMIRIQIWDLHCLLDQVFSLFLGKLMEQAHTPTLPYFYFDLLFSLHLPDPLSSPKMSFHFIFISLCAPVVLQLYRKEEVTCASCNHEAQEAKAQCWLQSPRTRSRDLNPIWSGNRNGSRWVVLSLIDGEERECKWVECSSQSNQNVD